MWSKADFLCVFEKRYEGTYRTYLPVGMGKDRSKQKGVRKDEQRPSAHPNKISLTSITNRFLCRERLVCIALQLLACIKSFSFWTLQRRARLTALAWSWSLLSVDMMALVYSQWQMICFLSFLEYCGLFLKGEIFDVEDDRWQHFVLLFWCEPSRDETTRMRVKPPMHKDTKRAASSHVPQALNTIVREWRWRSTSEQRSNNSSYTVKGS